MEYDKRFIPKGKGMGEYILNGTKKPFKGTPLKTGLNITQNQYLKNTRNNHSHRFKDSDGDGVINGMDCFPFDKKRHDTWNPFTGRWYQEREIPDMMRDGLHESLDVTRMKGKYNDVARGPPINTAPLIEEVQKRYAQKRQMQIQANQPYRLNEVQKPVPGQFGEDTDQYGI